MIGTSLASGTQPRLCFSFPVLYTISICIISGCWQFHDLRTVLSLCMGVTSTDQTDHLGSHEDCMHHFRERGEETIYNRRTRSKTRTNINIARYFLPCSVSRCRDAVVHQSEPSAVSARKGHLSPTSAPALARFPHSRLRLYEIKMKSFWALPAVLRLALAHQHAFSVFDDLLAFPQV
jgi:hypothetical protein